MTIAPLVSLEGVNGEQFTFSSKDGDESIVLQKGAKGLDMPPWDVQVDDYPALDGSFPRASRATSREIFLPLLAYGTTRREMITAKRRLMKALDPSRILRSMPRLVVAEADDTGDYEALREIEVYYAGGMDGDEGSGNGLEWSNFGLILRSTDPFFRARQDTVRDFLTFAATTPFFPEAPAKFLSDGVSGGFHLSSSPIFVNNIVVNNPGDVRVFPTWTIVGPVEGPFNLTRAATPYNDQQSLVVETLSLAAGETLTIVTQPGKLKVQASVGADAGWSALATNPDFWTLDPGDNTVSIDGLSSNPTSVSLSFRPKYLGM